jgi:membrane protease subunit HflC
MKSIGMFLGYPQSKVRGPVVSPSSSSYSSAPSRDLRARDLKKIESEAYRQAQEIKGKADAEATTIYARAYDQNPESREFYRFLKTMESYKNTLSEKDWLLLSTKGDFFKFLQDRSGR